MQRITNTTTAGLECLREVRRIAARIASFAPHVARYDQKEGYVAQAWVDLENAANDAEGIAQKAMMIAKLPHASRAAKEYAAAASEAAGDARFILQCARDAIAKAA